MAASKVKFIVAIVALIGLAALSMPISNFFLKREQIEVQSGVPEFKAVSLIMQNKCVDCHTPGMVSDPLYVNLPLASQLIRDDMAAAQQEIIFSKDHLNGAKPFSNQDLARIQNVVDNDAMPILPYRLMHWDAALTADDKAAFVAWVRAQSQANASSQSNQEETP